LKATEDGWLNRAIGSIREEEASPFRAVAMGPNLPRMLREAPGDCVVGREAIQSDGANPGAGKIAEGGFEAMYAQTVDQALRGTGTETFEAIDMLRKADPSKYQPGEWRGLSEEPARTEFAASGATD